MNDGRLRTIEKIVYKQLGDSKQDDLIQQLKQEIINLQENNNNLTQNNSNLEAQIVNLKIEIEKLIKEKENLENDLKQRDQIELSKDKLIQYLKQQIEDLMKQVKKQSSTKYCQTNITIEGEGRQRLIEQKNKEQKLDIVEEQDYDNDEDIYIGEENEQKKKKKKKKQEEEINSSPRKRPSLIKLKQLDQQNNNKLIKEKSENRLKQLQAQFAKNNKGTQLFQDIVSASEMAIQENQTQETPQNVNILQTDLRKKKKLLSLLVENNDQDQNILQSSRKINEEKEQNSKQKPRMDESKSKLDQVQSLDIKQDNGEISISIPNYSQLNQNNSELERLNEKDDNINNNEFLVDNDFEQISGDMLQNEQIIEVGRQVERKGKKRMQKTLNQQQLILSQLQQTPNVDIDSFLNNNFQSIKQEIPQQILTSVTRSPSQISHSSSSPLHNLNNKENIIIDSVDTNVIRSHSSRSNIKDNQKEAELKENMQMDQQNQYQLKLSERSASSGTGKKRSKSNQLSEQEQQLVIVKDKLKKKEKEWKKQEDGFIEILKQLKDEKLKMNQQIYLQNEKIKLMKKTSQDLDRSKDTVHRLVLQNEMTLVLDWTQLTEDGMRRRLKPECYKFDGVV